MAKPKKKEVVNVTTHLGIRIPEKDKYLLQQRCAKYRMTMTQMMDIVVKAINAGTLRIIIDDNIDEINILKGIHIYD